jgi:hypothetical protein
MSVLMRMFISNTFFFIAALSIAQPIKILQGREFTLKDENRGFLKSISDIKIYNDEAYIVDNAEHQVAVYEISADEFVFSRFIGRSGQGPGELQLPSRMSIFRDKIAIQDQGGISFFETSGKYISRFRFFSTGLSFVFDANDIYILFVNPTKTEIIDRYSMSGERIISFGDKPYSINELIQKGMRPVTTEMVLYDGILLSDDTSVFYLNKRFGTIERFDLNGKKIMGRDIQDILDKNAKAKIGQNKKLFLNGEFDMVKSQGQIPQYYIFREGYLIGPDIYLLLDQFDVGEKALNEFAEILLINKFTLKVSGDYRVPLKKKDRCLHFAIYRKQNEIQLIFPLDSDEGFKIFCAAIMNK